MTEFHFDESKIDNRESAVHANLLGVVRPPFKDSYATATQNSLSPEELVSDIKTWTAEARVSHDGDKNRTLAEDRLRSDAQLLAPNIQPGISGKPFDQNEILRKKVEVELQRREDRSGFAYAISEDGTIYSVAATASRDYWGHANKPQIKEVIASAEGVEVLNIPGLKWPSEK